MPLACRLSRIAIFSNSRVSTPEPFASKLIGPSSAEGSAARRERPRAGAAPRHGTVLVVDDDAAVAGFAIHVIQALGLRVVRARNGIDALRELEAESGLCVVLLDAAMPGLSGDRVLEEITSSRPDLPVVLSSGNAAGFENVDTDAPSRYWLHKPYRADALRDVLARSLETGARA